MIRRVRRFLRVLRGRRLPLPGITLLGADASVIRTWERR